MQVEDLAMIGLPERHVEAASSELSVVYHNYTLIHVVVEAFRHPVEGSNVLIQCANKVQIVARLQIRRK